MDTAKDTSGLPEALEKGENEISNDRKVRNPEVERTRNGRLPQRYMASSDDAK